MAGIKFLLPVGVSLWSVTHTPREPLWSIQTEDQVQSWAWPLPESSTSFLDIKFSGLSFFQKQCSKVGVEIIDICEWFSSCPIGDSGSLWYQILVSSSLLLLTFAAYNYSYMLCEAWARSTYGQEETESRGRVEVLVKGVLPGLVLSLSNQVPSQSCVHSSYCEHCWMQGTVSECVKTRWQEGDITGTGFLGVFFLSLFFVCFGFHAFKCKTWRQDTLFCHQQDCRWQKSWQGQERLWLGLYKCGWRGMRQWLVFGH